MFLLFVAVYVLGLLVFTPSIILNVLNVVRVAPFGLMQSVSLSRPLLQLELRSFDQITSFLNIFSLFSRRFSLSKD